MKVHKFLLCSFFVIPALSLAQSPTQSVDVGALKSQLTAQQKMLDQQQQQIKALQSALEEQRKMLQNLTPPAETPNAAALEKSVQDLQTSVNEVKAQEGQIVSPPLTPQQEKVEEELQRGPEIADVTPDTQPSRSARRRSGSSAIRP